MKELPMDQPRIKSFPRQSGAGRLALYQSAGYYAGFIVLGLVSAVLGPTLPGLAENTHTALGDMGFLFAARSVGYLVGSRQAGRQYDRGAGHRLMAGVILAMMLVVALVPLLPRLWMLVLALLLLGLFEASFDVGGNTLLVWLHGERVGPFMNGLHFFYGLGAFLSPVVVAQAILWGGDIRWAFWCLALLMLPAALWVARWPSPQPQKSVDTGKGGYANVWIVGAVALFLFLYVGAEVSYGGWVFTYTRARSALSEASAAYLTSAFWGALTLGRLASIPLASRFTPRVILSSDLAGCLLSIGAMLLFPGTPLVIWACTFGAGLFMASIFPTMITMAQRRLTITGNITGWFFIGAGLGGVGLPWLIGRGIQSQGPQVMPLAILIDLGLAAIVLAVMLWASGRRPVSTGAQH
jgi:MFS transporter, FHS family, Na+ dependent glucose transporter 1